MTREPTRLVPGPCCAWGRRSKGSSTWRALHIDPDSEDTRYNAACFFAALGDHEKALDCLARGLHDPDWMENDPDLEPLHAFPRFWKLMKQARERVQVQP